DLRVNGRLYSVLIPHGWKVADRLAADIVLEHSSGATFSYNNVATRGSDLAAVAQLGVDRTMRPLGFASFGNPLQRKLNGYPAVQYEIHGNRLSEHRRVLYLAVQREDSFYEVIYENSESGFDLLLPEVEHIGASIELTAANNERQ